MTMEITIFTRSYIFKWWFFQWSCDFFGGVNANIPQKLRTHVDTRPAICIWSCIIIPFTKIQLEKMPWERYLQMHHILHKFLPPSLHVWMSAQVMSTYKKMNIWQILTNYVYTYWSTCIPYIFMYIYISYVLINETPTFQDSHTHTSKTCLWKIHHLLQIWAICSQVQASCRWESLLSRLRFGEFSWCDFL